ncbi:MAG: hypothetical protein ACXADF_14905 [Candidatus Thorarchaeota archaeon]|jgi:hypothetical protein
MTTITLTKEDVDEAFGHARDYHQAHAMTNLYKLVHPRWDDIAKINGYPKCGKEIAIYIIEKFIDYDTACHPGCMPGGAWTMGSGWSSDDDLPPWDVDTSKCEVIYVEESEDGDLIVEVMHDNAE